MAVLEFEGYVPQIAPDAVVLPGTTVIGEVRVGSRSSVWYGSVVRGDDAAITIGSDSNIQDCSVVHADPGFPAVIGDRVTIGHGAVVHGASVDSDCLIGMRAVILNGARIGHGCVVGAGCIVREGQEIPPGSLAVGIPAQVKRGVASREREMIAFAWQDYVDKAIRHARAQK